MARRERHVARGRQPAEVRKPTQRSARVRGVGSSSLTGDTDHSLD